MGAAISLGVHTTPLEFFVQLAGEGLRVTSCAFEEVIDERPSLYRVLLRYAQVVTVQTSGTAFVNAAHTIEQRLARWLLTCPDRVDGNAIPITHEFIAMMLGVRRAGVTTAIHLLERNNLIQAQRGVVTIFSLGNLEQFAGTAYGLPEAEYARVMAEGR